MRLKIYFLKMSFIKTFFILIFVPFSLSLNCKDEEFFPLLVNNENSLDFGPDIEYCYKYSFYNGKNKIGFVFSKINSTSGEVLLYKNESDASIENYFDRFLISENSFKEIDVSNLGDVIYFVIRDNKYPKIYNSMFILYDSEIPIPLDNGKPFTLKHFFSINIYNFIYLSNGNMTFVYSTKVKSKKYINVTFNNETIIDKKVDDTDYILYLKSHDIKLKILYINIQDIEPGNEDQEFSVIVYERGITDFVEIEQNEIFNLNYVYLNKNDEIQTFLFYYKLYNSTKSNTINFKLDPIAKETKYINIISGQYHSTKEIKPDDLDDIFHFDENKLPLEYDINSDEYIKIYFKDDLVEYPYRYIYFKIEISKLEDYYSPKNILISVGEEVEEINFENIEYYSTKTIVKEIKPYLPTYFKMILDPNERYIFNSPYPKNSIYVKGDLIDYDEHNKIILNKNYFEDEDEIFVFSEISEFTVAVFCSETFTATFYIEKYQKDDLYILENMRNNDPFSIDFVRTDCSSNHKKYLLGIYNKEIYTKMNKTFTKYWTSNYGEMTVYYRNNIKLEGSSLFPDTQNYKVEKEEYIYINNYIDFFTFICSEPGALSLRSQYKTFNETTYRIGQNTFNTLNLDTNLIIIQPTAPIKPPSDFLCFAIYSKYGKKIEISPDYNALFQKKVIEGDEVFTLKINLYRFEPDQLAIKVQSNESTLIEVVEVIRYNFTEYTIVKNNKMNHFTDNHFVKFINPETRKIKAIIKGLKNVEVTYCLVKLFTDDVDFLPMAYQFRNSMKRIKAQEIENIEITNDYYENDIDNKKYIAFIFSIPNYKYYEFDAQVIEEIDKNNNNKKGTNKGPLIVGIIGAIISIALLIVIIVFCLVKKKENEKKFEMDIESMGNQPFND